MRHLNPEGGWIRSGARLIIVAAFLLALSGCLATRGSRIGGETPSGEAQITADAYSFNARVWRDGKPTSFKLELYYTDSLIGIAARGYLGKGAFKGWLRSDSIKVYFPQSNELLYESLDGLVKNSECGVSVAGLEFLSLFARTPDSLAMPTGVGVMHSGQTGRPHRAHETPVGRSGCR